MKNENLPSIDLDTINLKELEKASLDKACLRFSNILKLAKKQAKK